MAPKLSTLGQGITIQYMGGPFVAILGHFGPFLVHFWVNLAARARGWGQFGANFSPFKLFKTSWMTTNQMQWARLWTLGTSRGPFWPFFATFSGQSKRHLCPLISFYWSLGITRCGHLIWIHETWDVRDAKHLTCLTPRMSESEQHSRHDN